MLKLKLILSYIGIPIISIAVLIGILMLTNVFPKTNEQELGYNLILYNNRINQFSRVIFRFMVQVESNPDILDNPAYLSRMEKEFHFNENGYGIIVRKNRDLIHCTPWLNQPSILRKLPPFTIRRNSINSEQDIQLRPDYFTYWQDFYFADHSQGSLFLVINLTREERMLQSNLVVLGVLLIFIILITNVFLSWLMFRSFKRPLRQLHQAAERMKNGNLHSPIEHITRNDELSMLANAFEEMRVRLKQSLEIRNQSEINRRELIAAIANELKMPLAEMKQSIAKLNTEPNSSSRYIQRIRSMASEARYLNQLIEDLFLFSKLDLNKQPFQMEPLDLAIFIENFVIETEIRMADRHINLNLTTLPADSFLVNADQEKLARVFRIIIDCLAETARDSEENVILMGVLLHEKDLSIQFQCPTGTICPTEVARLFEEPAGLQNSLSKHSHLNLFIAKMIVQSHQGRIRCEESGSALCFDLPRISPKGAGNDHS